MLSFQRAGVHVTKCFFRRTYSSAGANLQTAAAMQSSNDKKDSATIKTESSPNTERSADSGEKVEKKPKSRMVEVAFESLKEEKNEPHAVNIDEKIINAKSVNGLLSVTELNAPLSRKHALKIVSILSDWSSMNRIKLNEFENDARFLRICRMLGRLATNQNKNGALSHSNSINNSNRKQITGFRTDDLNTVLGVAGDDEAAKLIASISLTQMVKVMSTLAQRKRRSTPLLRSLAFNISSSTDHLDLKQCADVLFAMATLNFPDSVLTAKLCVDIQTGLPKNKDKPAVVGSILTSLGILRYRDLDILEALTQWIMQNSDVCRPQDLSALFMTSAMLNFKSSNIEDVRKKLVNCIVKEDFTKPIDWLNHVWALSLLGIVEQKQLETVLGPEFITRLQNNMAQTQSTSQTTKMKLLNINSYARLLYTNYKGPLLATNSPAFDILLAHQKSKQILLNGLLDALKSLLSANNHFKSLVDSKMGFLFDVCCSFDAKRNPLPIDNEHPNSIKVALMVIDFHDVCHGPHRCATGITNLSFDLLEKSGYRVIPVPYNEFNTSDKLLKRVQYLEAKFKAAIENKN